MSSDALFAEMVGNHVVSEEIVEKDALAVTAGSGLSTKNILLEDKKDKNLTGTLTADGGQVTQVGTLRRFHWRFHWNDILA